MKNPRVLYLGLVLFIIWMIALTVPKANINKSLGFFSDDYDRFFYFERGMWFVNHQVPYRDTISEYPQVPTYLFGLVHIVDINERVTGIAYWKFSSFFSFLMLLILLATIELLYRMLPQKRYLAYFLLLPAPLFFALNRFDILPAFLTLLSYKLIHDKQWAAASIFLGVGALTKWYPALLLPIYMIYAYRNTGRFPWQMAALFSITCFIIILPTLAYGGLDALAVPYRFHLERGLETVSLPTLLNMLLDSVGSESFNIKTLSWVFLLLQVAAVPILAMTKVDNLNKLLNSCILIISLFVLFSRIYSPQWMLWILPFSILAARNKWDISILILYGTITYVGFPIVWGYSGIESMSMIVMGIVNAAFLIVIAVSAAFQIANSESAFVSQTEATP